MPDPERIMELSIPAIWWYATACMYCDGTCNCSKFMIADEPTTNLDVTIQDQVLKLIRNLTDEKDMSLILITHSMGVARMMADRICVMYAGNIVENAKTEELLEKPQHPYTVG